MSGPPAALTRSSTPRLPRPIQADSSLSALTVSKFCWTILRMFGFSFFSHAFDRASSLSVWSYGFLAPVARPAKPTKFSGESSCSSSLVRPTKHLVFLIFFATPGVDPTRSLAGRNPTPETIAAVRHQFGLDRSKPMQYLLMMKRLFVSRDLVSYGNQALLVVPAIASADRKSVV